MKKVSFLIFFLCFSLSFSQTVGLQSFASGFTSPVEIAHPPNDSRLFVVQQGGAIKILNSDGTVNATAFLTLTSSTIVSGGERGLLGLAFHPDYTTNGYFYVNYTRAGDGATVIARYSVSADPNIANDSSGTILMTIAQPFANHNGGSLKFGPDGYLYIGTGDGGSGGDPGNRAQNINDNLGKMLRIDVDSASPYGIPSSNPYVSVAGNDEIWAIGLRNPWKFSFNRLNGDLWIADVGQGSIEEINKITSPLSNTGLNFGWRCYEGNATYNTSGTCPAYNATVAPINQYSHTSGRCSVTGGYVYTGTLYPNFQNNYFFADYCTGEIGTINSDGVLTWEYTTPSSITTFGEDRNGELYVAAGNTIYKIIDTSLGIKGVKKKALSIFPNPAKNEIFIQNDSETFLSKAKIFDLTGKLLSVKFIENGNNPRITISGLARGLYMLTVEDLNGNQYSSKIIIE